MGNPLDGDASPRGNPTEPQAARFTRSAVTYLNKETAKAAHIDAPAAEFAVCRNFLLLWNKSGAKIGEGVIFSGYDRQTKEKTAAKAQGC